MGINVKVRMEVSERCEFDIQINYAETQLLVFYASGARQDENNYILITFPYYGAMFNYKF